MKKEINANASEVNWKGKKMTGSHKGTIDLKDGFLLYEDDKLVGGEFEMDMPSINVTDLSGEGKEKLEGHLKSEDFFGVEKHPVSKLVFNSVAKKDDGTYGVVGNLTIKEHTNPVTFDLDLNGDSAYTALTIDRTKYHVKYGSGSFFQNLGDNTIYDNFELDVNLKLSQN